MLEFKPTNWSAVGCSYRYNTVNQPWRGFTSSSKLAQADPEDGFTSKPSGWVPNPSKYILMHEPPAKRYRQGGYVHWHFARSPTDVASDEIEFDNQKFIAPILFVDGHSANHDFTKVHKESTDFPYEPTANWIWYKPKDPVEVIYP